MIAIRDEQPTDFAAIADVTFRAFADIEQSDQTEPAIVAGLRDAGALALSLVAVEDGEIVGHIAFSPVLIDGRDCGWLGLGPLSVRPDRQCRGIGSALVRSGLDRLRTRNAAGCVVLGEPAYYGRFGFASGDRLHFTGAPGEYFMLLDLPAGDSRARGQVDYHPAFFGSQREPMPAEPAGDS